MLKKGIHGEKALEELLPKVKLKFSLVSLLGFAARGTGNSSGVEIWQRNI